MNDAQQAWILALERVHLRTEREGRLPWDYQLTPKILQEVRSFTYHHNAPRPRLACPRCGWGWDSHRHGSCPSLPKL